MLVSFGLWSVLKSRYNGSIAGRAGEDSVSVINVSSGKGRLCMAPKEAGTGSRGGGMFAGVAIIVSDKQMPPG